MGSAYPAHEIDRIRDWAHDIAGGPVTLKRAIKMWEARQAALDKLRTDEAKARDKIYEPPVTATVTPLGRYA